MPPVLADRDTVHSAMEISIRDALPADADDIAALLTQLGYPSSSDETRSGTFDTWRYIAVGGAVALRFERGARRSIWTNPVSCTSWLRGMQRGLGFIFQRSG
jgi:hypothetical protein